MKHYSKLVRDKIPQIIEAAGKTCTCSILTEREYRALLDAKLNEEVVEYQESGALEELADILEVIRAIAATRGSSIEEIEAIRQEKREARGGFEQRILLEDVFDQGERP
jgi:predicted house-cleaning noncanonical NTP pyrophosphatase (MazG superfamily)